MGDYKFSSWGIHKIMLVVISAMVGLAFREWKSCRRPTWATLGAALTVLFLAVLTLAYGNYLCGSASSH